MEEAAADFLSYFEDKRTQEKLIRSRKLREGLAGKLRGLKTPGRRHLQQEAAAALENTDSEAR